MASYNFYDNEERPLRDRYLTIFDGELQNESFNLWRSTFNSNRPTEDELENLLNKLKQLPAIPPRSGCFRLFISHRRIDKDYALRIANIAYDSKFEIWLDVLNPPLTRVTASTRLSLTQKILLTACIIEMGLINSTHVLAIMTQDTKGGEWVPYEYGRIRGVGNTACWRHPSHSFTLPDYMLLGDITDSESEIEGWLAGFSPPCSPIPWTWATTTPLP